MTEHDCCNQLVELAASLFSRGYSVGGGGNISLRLPGGSVMVTPTGACLGRLTAQEISIVDGTGKLLRGSEPTKELPLHLSVYAAKPSCKAIVHLHSTYITALSCLADIDPENALRAFTPYYVMKVGRLPVVPYFKPGAAELGVCAGKIAPEVNAFLLANHGSVVCGPSLVDAVNSAEELEETAKLYFLLLSSGKKVRYLSDKEVAELSPAKGAAR